MPIGLLICFAPAVVVWFLTSNRKPDSEQDKDHK